MHQTLTADGNFRRPRLEICREDLQVTDLIYGLSAPQKRIYATPSPSSGCRSTTSYGSATSKLQGLKSHVVQSISTCSRRTLYPSFTNNHFTSHTIVLQVGGGPTALATALTLAKNGISIRIIQKDDHFHIGQRGAGIQVLHFTVMHVQFKLTCRMYSAQDARILQSPRCPT